ncbi:MAG: PDZ domain-containing protein [Phycisphaerae bacterium]|mgnify:CR=1 FL=1|nr:PDZ domain-containing protein [Phycisphaerae bacterium]
MFSGTGSRLTAVVVILGLAAIVYGQESPDPAIIERIAPSLVRVEYTLQYDKGQAPVLGGSYERCPNCGGLHWRGSDDYVGEERPMETSGFLIASDRVVSTDAMIHPRFVKGIAVRFGDSVVAAEIEAVARDQSAVFLKLSEPLPQAKPLAFDPSCEPPFLAVTYQLSNGCWAINVQGLSKNVTETDTGRRFMPAPSQCLIVDKSGAPVAVGMSEELPLDGTWKGSPAQWAVLSAEAYAARLAVLKDASEQCLLRVSLNFRSPKADASEQSRWYSGYGGEDDSVTELHVPGILCGDKRILVLAGLKPKVTARLERITAHWLGGREMSARFVGSLRDYQAFWAELEQPMPAPAVLSSEDIRSHRRRLLPAVDLKIKGENCEAYYAHGRMGSYNVGWKGQIYPQLSFVDLSLFLFDEAGLLVAFPLARREKVSVEERWRSQDVGLTAAVYLGDCVRDPVAHCDPSNVPLSEEEENRLAWLGVELQPMEEQLARAQKIAHLTNDGESGALVTYVYPDSPAASAGVAVGDILLRLHVPDQPKPLEVQLDDQSGFSFDDFPWEQLNEIPAEYLSQLPKPWPSVDNRFIRALSDLGFGKPFEAEFWRDGEAVRKSFSVVEGPRHYDSATRYKNEEMGLNVRDLTYEVRRHFQMKPEDPGIIVAKIEPGEKAAVAGLVPYEIITEVNGEPVTDVKAFEQKLAGGGEVKLSVKRKNRGRVVKIQLSEASSVGATQAAEEPEAKITPPGAPSNE